MAEHLAKSWATGDMTVRIFQKKAFWDNLKSIFEKKREVTVPLATVGNLMYEGVQHVLRSNQRLQVTSLKSSKLVLKIPMLPKDHQRPPMFPLQ